MRLRWDDPQVMKPSQPEAAPRRSVYDHHTEALTVEDVEGLRSAALDDGGDGGVFGDSLTWEGLVIRERILGVASEELALSIWETADRIKQQGAENYHKERFAFEHLN